MMIKVTAESNKTVIKLYFEKNFFTKSWKTKFMCINYNPQPAEPKSGYNLTRSIIIQDTETATKPPNKEESIYQDDTNISNCPIQ